MENIKILHCEKHGDVEHGYYNGRWRCKKCMVEYDKEKRHRIKQELVNYKGGKCEICGYNKCLNALDFHHKNKEDKSFALNAANYNRSIEELKKEVDKCILVCANCHREIHYNENEERAEKNLIFNGFIKKIGTIDIEKVKADLKKGLYQTEIAQKYNISVSTLKRFLEKEGLVKKRKKFDVTEVLNAYKIESTYVYLSKFFNTTMKVVKGWCLNNNVVPLLNEIRKEKGLKPIKENAKMYK